MPVPSSINDLDPVATDNSPAGSEQVFPNLDNYLRAHAAFIAQLRDLVRDAAPAIGMTQWWGGNRAHIPAKHQPQDGQEANRADYPTLWALVSSGGMPLVPESSWQSNPSLRGSFSTGNGSSTFRFPDLNGKQTNSIGAVVLRGDGSLSTGTPGGMQDSQNLSHSHVVDTYPSGQHTHNVSGSTSSNGDHQHGTSVRAGGSSEPGNVAAWDYGSALMSTGSAGQHYHSVTATAEAAGSHAHSGTAREDGGSEARMKSVTGVWVIRAL